MLIDINRNNILRWTLLFVAISVVWISLAYANQPQLTSNKIKNAEYYVYFLQKKIKLVNGQYEFAGEDFKDYVWIEKVTFGDLNNDRRKNAAVILVSSGGGTGRFYELAVVLNKGGKPYNITSVQLGDRVEIKSLIIKKGKIILKMITHGPNDAACCPTVKKLIEYRLLGNKLMEQ